MSEETKPAEAPKVKRPKAGSYPTFTSRKKASTICFQKAVYGLDEFKVRRLVSDKVSVTVQEGVEFDAYRECYGDENGKGRSQYFHKLVTDGYLENGKTVKLDPDKLHRFLLAQVNASTNSIYEWKDRPRTAAEKKLEGAIADRDKKIEDLASDKARMEALLKKHNIAYAAG